MQPIFIPAFASKERATKWRGYFTGILWSVLLCQGPANVLVVNGPLNKAASVKATVVQVPVTAIEGIAKATRIGSDASS